MIFFEEALKHTGFSSLERVSSKVKKYIFSLEVNMFSYQEFYVFNEWDGRAYHGFYYYDQSEIELLRSLVYLNLIEIDRKEIECSFRINIENYHSENKTLFFETPEEITSNKEVTEKYLTLAFGKEIEKEDYTSSTFSVSPLSGGMVITVITFDVKEEGKRTLCIYNDSESIKFFLIDSSRSICESENFTIERCSDFYLLRMIDEDFFGYTRDEEFHAIPFEGDPPKSRKLNRRWKNIYCGKLKESIKKLSFEEILLLDSGNVLFSRGFGLFFTSPDSRKGCGGCNSETFFVRRCDFFS